jgi:hypothetical protein
MCGFDAFDMEITGQGFAGGRMGRYEEVCQLADKVARFMFEFHAKDCHALPLPAISSTASSRTIHKVIENRP